MLSAHYRERHRRRIDGAGLHGAWRNYGPWTDLYALGCMAYLLSAGVPPFQGKSVWSIDENDLDAAREYYRRADHFARATGHVLSRVTGAFLGFCDIEDGDYDSAYAHFIEMDKVPIEKFFPVYRPIAPLGYWSWQPTVASSIGLMSICASSMSASKKSPCWQWT